MARPNPTSTREDTGDNVQSHPQHQAPPEAAQRAHQDRTRSAQQPFADAYYDYGRALQEAQEATQEEWRKLQRGHQDAVEEAQRTAQRQRADLANDADRSLREAKGEGNAPQQLIDAQRSFQQHWQQVDQQFQDSLSGLARDLEQGLQSFHRRARQREHDAYVRYVLALQKALGSLDPDTLDPQVLMSLAQSVLPVAAGEQQSSFRHPAVL